MRGRTREFTELSHQVIGAALEVHRVVGPGLLESTYRRCLAYELTVHGLEVVVEQSLPITYKGLQVDAAYRIDLLVENEIILEVKCVSAFSDAHQKQLLTYMRHARIRQGFLVNFAYPRLMDGVLSFVL